MTRSTAKPTEVAPPTGYPARVSPGSRDAAQAAASPLQRGGSRLNDAVYDQLKERLLEGRYEAGERVSAEVLRLEFGVSKQPVMEALRRLAGDGLMEIVPQVGSRVARYDLREVEDFYEAVDEVSLKGVADDLRALGGRDARAASGTVTGTVRLPREQLMAIASYALRAL